VCHSTCYVFFVFSAELDGKFSPGILNTVVFLVSSVQQVTVFFVNIQGRPFMTGISENSPLLWSLAGTFILVFMFASESVPKMNRYFQLVPFPDDTFRNFILVILVMDLVGTFIFDRLMKFIFARDILKAAFQGTRRQDVIVLARTFAIVGFLMYQLLGADQQWEELMKMEEAMMNGANSTDAVLNATDCVNGVCDAVAETVKEIAMTATTVLDDEF
jgi:manganese-transporting P-type ATPase